MVAIGFIFISLTMNKSITLVLVLDANPQVAPLPVSGRPIISILNFLKIAAAVFASIVFICDMSAEARCGTCASARQCMGAGLVFPERLVGAQLRVDRLPSCGCSKPRSILCIQWSIWSKHYQFSFSIQFEG